MVEVKGLKVAIIEDAVMTGGTILAGGNGQGVAASFDATITLRQKAPHEPTGVMRRARSVKYWNQIDQDSESWLDALFEKSWAYFMAGDYRTGAMSSGPIVRW